MAVVLISRPSSAAICATSCALMRSTNTSAIVLVLASAAPRARVAGDVGVG